MHKSSIFANLLNASPRKGFSTNYSNKKKKAPKRPWAKNNQVKKVTNLIAGDICHEKNNCPSVGLVIEEMECNRQSKGCKCHANDSNQ
jgi:hypothetical protein